MKIAALRFILCASTLFGITSAAQAQMITYPAAGCEALSGTPYLTSDGQLWNSSSSSTLKVLCPMSRLDQDPNFKGDVFVIDRNASYSITCTPYANNVGGLNAGTAKSSAGASTTYQTLSFGDPTYGYSFTSRYYICTIPPTYNGAYSGLILYRGETY